MFPRETVNYQGLGLSHPPSLPSECAYSLEYLQKTRTVPPSVLTSSRELLVKRITVASFVGLMISAMI